MAKRQRTGSGTSVIGWREVVDLPDLGILSIRAKIDTGARTSALHATRQEVVERDGQVFMRFHVPRPGVPRGARIEAPLVDRRAIRNTSGVAEERAVIRTHLRLGGRCWLIEVSLADRARMEFDLILGRTALRRRGLLVDAGRSMLAGPPGGRGAHTVEA